jgi:hypothetical protein
MNREIVFNHDGYGILEDLAKTAMTERDAADLVIKPLADAGVAGLTVDLLDEWSSRKESRQMRILNPAT